MSSDTPRCSLATDVRYAAKYQVGAIACMNLIAPESVVVWPSPYGEPTATSLTPSPSRSNPLATEVPKPASIASDPTAMLDAGDGLLSRPTIAEPESTNTLPCTCP